MNVNNALKHILKANKDNFEALLPRFLEKEIDPS